MKYKKGIAFFEGVLLVMGIIAFSYSVAQIFKIVNAQSSDGTPDLLANAQQSVSDQGLSVDPNNPTNVGDNLDTISNNAGDEVINPPEQRSAIGQVIDAAVPDVSQINQDDFINSLNDKTGGQFTCPVSKSGEVCQEFSGNECEDKCDGECIEGDRESLPADSDCFVGTCYVEDKGICMPRSTKERCNTKGGNFIDKPVDKIPECKKGCCLIDSEAQFVTEGQCQSIVEGDGLEIGVGGIRFAPEITAELECLGQVYALEEGACVIPSPGDKNDCKFVTLEECTQLSSGSNTNFSKGFLCSNPGLNTSCQKQNSTACVDGLDEIYWFDSCGNRENIYDSDKDKSWNNGLVLPKNESCSVNVDSNNVGNQKECGNCNRLTGSFCGDKTDKESLSDENQSSVCLDMGCYDPETNERREHGESWCAYQSSIGLPGEDGNTFDISSMIPNVGLLGGGNNRATDPPGSRHFRKECLNGKIQTSPCGDFRNEICVEQRDSDFSQAFCRISRWEECLAYNPDRQDSRIIGLAGDKWAKKILDARLALTCGPDPDCFVKTVDIDKYFKFSYCAPKYPPGFEIDNFAEGSATSSNGEEICAQATQACTAVFVKKTNGWKCDSNCDCIEGGDNPGNAKPSKKFVRQMNNFCTSLGDCGYDGNYIGDVGKKGYNAYTKKHDDNGGSSALTGLKPDLSSLVTLFGGGGASAYLEDSELVDGEYIDVKTYDDAAKKKNNFDSFVQDNFGIDLNSLFGQSSGSYGTPNKTYSGTGYALAGVSGALGVGAAGLSMAGVGTTLPYTIELIPELGGDILIPGSAGPLGAFGGAFIGAAVGVAGVAFLLDALGISPGLSSGEMYGLMAMGGVGGAVYLGSGISAALAPGATAGSFNAGLAAANPIGIILIVVVIIILVILKVMGVGDIEKIDAVFECKPWKPPQGSNSDVCRSCGNDTMSDGTSNFPCSRYSCESLGGNCKFIDGSETINGGICVALEHDDVAGPKIDSVGDISDGYEFKDISSNEFKIVKKDRECLDQFEQMTFSLNTNEYAECTVSGTPDGPYLPITLVGSNGRTQIIPFRNIADYENLGIDIQANTQNDLTLYVDCVDALGNSAETAKIHVCIVPDDLTAPRVSVSGDENVLPYGATSADISVNTNEIAECRWDILDLPYGELSNVMNCGVAGVILDSGSSHCSARIPIESDSESICIKCRDHPELTDAERNANVECVGGGTTLVKSESALEIVSISPNDEIIVTGSRTTGVILGVETSGGVDGTAVCKFSLNGGSGDTFGPRSTTHSYTLDKLSPGVKNVDVSCEDSAGNFAEASSSFEIRADKTQSNIARVYKDGGSLIVITNEAATCSYVNEPLSGSNACNFDVEGEEIGIKRIPTVGSEGLIHSTNFDIGLIYNIKCRDLYGNERVGECDLVVTEGDF